MLRGDGAQASVGRIITELAVTNRIDKANTKAGLLPADRVRSIHLTNVLVDTGAKTLCLPRKAIERLGLEPLREVNVGTAQGATTARPFQDARVRLLDREGGFECLELPGRRQPILGFIPLEALGIEPDLRNQTLRVLPITGDDAYLTIM